MKKSELCVVGFMLVFCGFFYYETMQLPPLAQSYPLFVICLLACLSLLKLVNMFLAYLKSKDFVDDNATVWHGFKKKQFFTVFLASVLFFVVMYFFGFYVASLVYLVFCLRYFQISKKNTIITITAMLIIVYLVFSTFLNVPLPPGELISNFI